MPVVDEANRELELLEPDDYDPVELTPAQSRMALRAWYRILAGLILTIALVLLGSMQADAVDLTISISGNSSGQGSHIMTFSGSLLHVNVSQENETSWNVTAEGGQPDDI